jgi:hypothetical protein
MGVIDYTAHPELIAAARELDRTLWPICDRILARLGKTRADVLARPPVISTPAPSASTVHAADVAALSH